MQFIVSCSQFFNHASYFNFHSPLGLGNDEFYTLAVPFNLLVHPLFTTILLPPSPSKMYLFTVPI